MALLEGWDNFYVILGSAAAGLMGLTFVVIALISDVRRANPAGTSAYITPTIVHFGTVLALCCYMSAPHQSAMSLSLAFGATAIGTLGYSVIVTVNIRRFASSYTPVLEDWVWHVTLPILAYGSMLAMAVLIWHHAQGSLYGIAAALLLLLFIGIHNAWDVAVSVTLQKRNEQSGPGKEQQNR